MRQRDLDKQRRGWRNRAEPARPSSDAWEWELGRVRVCRHCAERFVSWKDLEQHWQRVHRAGWKEPDPL